MALGELVNEERGQISGIRVTTMRFALDRLQDDGFQITRDGRIKLTRRNRFTVNQLTDRFHDR